MREINQNVAVSIDIRNLPKEPKLVTDTLEQLESATDIDVNVLLFLDASKQTLLKRYSEHAESTLFDWPRQVITWTSYRLRENPLIPSQSKLASSLIGQWLQPLAELSEKVRFKVEGKEKQELIIVFQSFGFKIWSTQWCRLCVWCLLRRILTGNRLFDHWLGLMRLSILF